MQLRRHTGEIGIEVFWYLNRSPLRRDILEFLQELPVATIGVPVPSLGFIHTHAFDPIGYGKTFFEFCFRHGRLVSRQRVGAASRNAGSGHRSQTVDWLSW